MRRTNLYIDFHIVQTVPPSCINRDDTGTPKTCTYGGTTRARVSSQAWKHAMREAFRQEFDAEKIGSRTKHVQELLAGKIREISSLSEEDAMKKATEVLKDAGLSVSEKTNTLDTLLFISEDQLKAFAKCACEAGDKKGKESKEAYKNALKENPSVDMVLFGRMIASDPSLNYDAAAQVAHAISTHALQQEYDYFTAVDDCSPEDNAGAGHIGTTEFCSATLYRYASVNVAELESHLGADSAEAVTGFTKAMILSMPTGKQSTFANRTIPDLVYVTVRRDQPVNLCGAYEKAVPASKNGYVEESEKRLFSYAKKVYEDFVDQPEAEYVVGGEESGRNGVSLKELLSALEETVKSYTRELSD